MLTAMAVLCALHNAIGASETRDLAENWRFRPDKEHVGISEGWASPSYSDADWVTIRAGKRWEDQGFPDLDGYAWYRQHVEIPSAWRGGPVWLVLGGINDAGVVYCNGKRVNSFGDNSTRSVAVIPIMVELSDFLEYGKPNLIAIEVFDWGASGGLWRPPCLLTTDPERLPVELIFSCFPDFEARQLSVDISLAGLGNERPTTPFRIELSAPGSPKPVASLKLSAPRGVETAMARLDVPDVRPGESYEVRIAAQGADGKDVAGLSMRRELKWPANPIWPDEYKTLKVLNNFVTELLVSPAVADDDAKYEFANPRKGWVFFSVSKGKAALDDRTEALVWRVNPDTGACEAMQMLSEGRHRLRLTGAKDARLDVRAVPEILFCYYPEGPLLPPFGPYDKAYAERYIFPHVNAIITRRPVDSGELARWASEGRLWIGNNTLPGLSDTKAPLPESVYDIWAKSPGMAEPGYGGIMVDEFGWAGEEHYRAWGEALKRIHATPAFRDRMFYAWCGDLFRQEPCLGFSRLLMELGYRFSWEKYLREEPTQEKARHEILRQLVRDMTDWKAAMPGVERHVVMCLGYLSAPPESLNLNPGVDYHVFMDMQFRALATEPAFWGLYGIMEYMAAYADEESLRYAQKLFRHYCIEGKRTPYNSDPYILPHLVNPDFADSLAGWNSEPAEEGATGIRKMEGFSYLQGRYPKTEAGDQYCWMKRSAVRPNSVTQTIKALDPSRLYSLKMISADVEHLDVKQELALRIAIDDVEIIKDFGFQCAYPSSYSHDVGPYNKDHPAYLNLHRVVFRPKSQTAKLTISDWAGPAEPGGPIGQEIGFNFVEVQPFHAP